MSSLTTTLFFALVLVPSILCMVVPSKANGNPEESGPFIEGDIIPSGASFSGRLDTKYRWNNNTVHYQFEENYPAKLQATFLQAVAQIVSRTCLKFSASPARDYIYVSSSSSSSCSSYVGRQGGRQLLSLPAKCDTLGTFIHELLHSIGFHHEQSRPDRDDFVNILWENVSPGKEPNFRKYDASTVSTFQVPYDYASILHYSQFAFSRQAGKFTIQPKTATNQEIGQRAGMSDKDVEKVNRMYECSGLL